MNENFQWRPQPEAQVVLDRLCAELLERSVFLQTFSSRLEGECGTRLFDWIDYLVVPVCEVQNLTGVGFEIGRQGGLNHRGAVFP